MLLLALAFLTLEQRRLPLYFCSPDEAQMSIPTTASSRSIYTANIYKWTISQQQLTQSRGRGLIIGTNQRFLDQFVQLSYDHSLMQEIRQLYISPGSTLGDLYVKLREAVSGEEFQYLIMPTYNCGLYKGSTKIFERYNVSALTNVHQPINYTLAFEQLINEVFGLRDRSYRKYISPNLYVDKVLKKQFLVMTTPFDASLKHVAESYITCPVTSAGKRLTRSTCFTSISVGAVSDTAQREQIRLSDMMIALLGQTLIMSSFADLQRNSTTNQIRQMMAQSAKISNINQLIESKNGQIYQVGLGFGFISLTQMMRYSYNTSGIQADMDSQEFHAFGHNNISFNQVFSMNISTDMTYKIHMTTIAISKRVKNDTMAQLRYNINATDLDPESLRHATIMLCVVDEDSNLHGSTIIEFPLSEEINILARNSTAMITSRALFASPLAQTYKITSNISHPEDYQLSVYFQTEMNQLHISFISTTTYKQRTWVLLRLQSQHIGQHYLYYHCVNNGIDTYGSVSKVLTTNLEPVVLRTRLKITNQHCRLYYCFNIDEAHFSKVQMLGKYCAYTENYRMGTFSNGYILGVLTFAVSVVLIMQQRYYFQDSRKSK